ncbi:hypothetical protein WMY93_031324, partial [Mugilogobius chulae]
MLRCNKVGVSDEYDPESLENVRKDGRRRPGGTLEILAAVVTALSVVWIALTFPVNLWRCARIIKEYERAVIFRLGRLIKSKVKGPGLFWIIPWLDEIQTVDLRTVCIDIEPQRRVHCLSPFCVDICMFVCSISPPVSV